MSALVDRLLAGPHKYAALPRDLVEAHGLTVPDVICEIIEADRCGVSVARVGLGVTEVCLHGRGHRYTNAGDAQVHIGCGLPADQRRSPLPPWVSSDPAAGRSPRPSSRPPASRAR